MYAIEFFLFSILLGIIAIANLYSYFKSSDIESEQLSSDAHKAFSLLDEYESIYLNKDDDQMERLVDWRNKTLANCKARRERTRKAGESSGVAFISEYRSQFHASSKPR